MLISFFNKHRFTLAMLAAGISIALVAGTAAAYGYVPELMLLILGSIICILIVRWPVVGVALILVLTPLEGIVAINQSLSAAKVAGLVSMVVFIGYIAFRRINLELDRIVKISIVLLGWTFASILWAGNTKANINALLSLVLIYALYILMINMIRSRRDLKITIWAFISGNVLLAFI